MKTLHYVVCALSLLTINATVAQAANGGIIHFRGQIVEGPCEYQPVTRQIHVSCYENSKHVERVIPVSALMTGQTIVDEKSTMRLQWIDRDRKLAILNVEYK